MTARNDPPVTQFSLDPLRDASDDSFMRALDSALIDDEPTTPKENREAAEAWDEGGMSAEEAKRTFLMVLDDPLTRFLNAAPVDDEPTSPEEDREAAAARAEVRRGETVSAEKVKRSLLNDDGPGRA